MFVPGAAGAKAFAAKSESKTSSSGKSSSSDSKTEEKEPRWQEMPTQQFLRRLGFEQGTADNVEKNLLWTAAAIEDVKTNLAQCGINKVSTSSFRIGNPSSFANAMLCCSALRSSLVRCKFCPSSLPAPSRPRRPSRCLPPAKPLLQVPLLFPPSGRGPCPIAHLGGALRNRGLLCYVAR